MRGLTANETCAATGLDYRSVSPRFKPLREKGLIAILITHGAVIKRDGQQVHYALQRDLTGTSQAHSREDDPDTSLAAARRVNTKKLEARVLKAIWDADHDEDLMG
jgi:DNA-binding transcriptional ArsR family regulator